MMHRDKKYVAIVITLVALVGGVWIYRSKNSAPQNAYAQGYPPTASTFPQQPSPPLSDYGQPATTPRDTPIPVATAGNYDLDGYYPSVLRPIYVRPAVYNPPAESPLEPADGAAYIDDQPSYGGTRVHRVEQHRGRSKKKSVAIVAGTAGVGAAIGAVAAGGKGAALGGLSGGAAGFLYDRITHKH